MLLLLGTHTAQSQNRRHVWHCLRLHTRRRQKIMANNICESGKSCVVLVCCWCLSVGNGVLSYRGGTWFWWCIIHIYTEYTHRNIVPRTCLLPYCYIVAHTQTQTFSHIYITNVMWYLLVLLVCHLLSCYAVCVRATHNMSTQKHEYKYIVQKEQHSNTATATTTAATFMV